MTLPPVPLVDSSQLVDAGGLSTLKQAAANNSPQALREAARQFESLFTSMVLKSMREASFKDPLFGSDQADLYQEMYDDQVAAEMSKGKGLGLADMLVQQLRQGAIGGADPSRTTSSTAMTSARAAAAGNAARAGSAAASPHVTASAAPGSNAPTHSAVCPSSAEQAEFARTLWPEARQAARQLGVSPVTLLAQAALETNWGRSVPHAADGGTSNNLFGIKASKDWSGPAVVNGTQEYAGGVAGMVKAPFRAYDSTSQCFQDYVSLLKSNPRYAAALGTGGDVHAFGSALQQGGYATDPAYASKLSAVAGTLARALTPPAASLKFAASLPTTDGSGTLQRR